MPSARDGRTGFCFSRQVMTSRWSFPQFQLLWERSARITPPLVFFTPSPWFSSLPHPLLSLVFFTHRPSPSPFGFLHPPPLPLDFLHLLLPPPPWFSSPPPPSSPWFSSPPPPPLVFFTSPLVFFTPPPPLGFLHTSPPLVFFTLSLGFLHPPPLGLNPFVFFPPLVFSFSLGFLPTPWFSPSPPWISRPPLGFLTTP